MVTTTGDIASSRLSGKFAQALQDAINFLHTFQCPCLAPAEDALRELIQSTQKPFNVAVFGRMKTGKSSLINALLGARLAITGTEEATATINLISYTDDPNLLEKFTVHWIGRPSETFPLSELQRDWTGKTDEVKGRVKQTRYIQLYSDYPSLKLHEVIDTPGTGSDVVEHEKAAQDILKSFSELVANNGTHPDALVYVFPPVGRENDEEALQTFRAGCLPGSDAYNSVGVLHKWDHIYWENGGDFSEIQHKADVLKDAMNGLLANVFPVSAPLATAAILLPDSFYNNLMEVISEKGDQIQVLLKRDERWDRDPQCQVVREIAGDFLPWQSFQIVVRECLKQQNCKIDEIRKRIFALSGLPALRDFLDRNFFAMGAIIRQKQNIAKLEKIRAAAIAAVDAERKRAERETVYWNDLFEQNNANLKLRAWIANKRDENLEEIKKYKSASVAIDKMFLDGAISLTIKDMDSLKWSETTGTDLFSASEHDMIRQIFNYFCGLTENVDFDLEALLSLSKKLCMYGQFYPDRMAKIFAMHIQQRIIALSQCIYFGEGEDRRS